MSYKQLPDFPKKKFSGLEKALTLSDSTWKISELPDVWVVLVLVVQRKSQWRVVYVYKTIICVFFFLFFIQVIAIVMDMFTDVDIFREIVEASTRGTAVYLLLDESNFGHFLKMTEKQGCQVQRLRVRLTVFLCLDFH